MDEITVLITGVGSTTGISVVKGLRKQDEFRTRIVGTDSNLRDIIAGSSFCDVFHTVPLAIEPHYVSRLLEICQKEHVQILIPIVEPELLVLAEHKEDFTQIGVEVVVSDPHTIRICNDKFKTVQFLRSHGITTPQTWRAQNITDPYTLTYPIFVKPNDGISSVNAFRIDSAEELACIKKKVSNLIVQEYLVGAEYTIDVLADYEGQVLAVVPRLRLQTKAGISYKGRTCHDERLIEDGKRIAEALEIRGPANIQCMVFDEQVSYFEVNPRFSGSLPLTIAAGVNTPLWLLKLSNGVQTPDTLLPFQSLVMTRYLSEIFYPSEQQATLPSDALKPNYGKSRENPLVFNNPTLIRG